MPDLRNRTTGEQGFALVLVLMLCVAVVALAGAAATIGTTTASISSYYARQNLLGRSADAGIELARARLNGDPALYPDSGYATLELDAPVRDATGAVVPGALRSTYAGPLGVTSGEYGIIGAVVSVVRDPAGGVAIRRQNLPQESFAKFAYFTDVEPSNIAFGGGDQLYGPVHSNDRLRIYSSGATFFGPVSTAQDIQGRQYGDFREGYEESASAIPLPEVADLLKLRRQAAAGGTDFPGNGPAAWGRATTRIEFVAVDLNGDGDGRDANEGFVRVYQSGDADWLMGAAPTANLRNSRTCGHWHGPLFVDAASHPNSGPDSWVAAVTNATRACYLGGAPELSGVFTPNDGRGRWLRWGGAVSPLLAARPDRDYLFPITRALNPNFKGVIFVSGDVAVSGTLRGRVTVAATGNIVIADDVTYSIDPATGSCDDILGLFAGGDVIVANTPINAPWQRSSGQSYFSYDNTADEFIHGFVLTLNTFTVEDYGSGSSRDEPCQGSQVGRGCLYLTGGIIQRTRGAVGQGSWWGLTGYLKRYSYDACGATEPPPYFPTTGRFSRGTYYEVDPVGFSADSYFNMLTAGS